MEKKFDSPKFNYSLLPKGSFEKDVYESVRHGGKNKWVVSFKNMLVDWHLFGDHGYIHVDPLITFGLHRVAVASGFQLDSSLHINFPKSPSVWETCIRNILNDIGLDLPSNYNMKRDELYQLLLGFYGRYKSEATRGELDAIKNECAAEKLLQPGLVKKCFKAKQPLTFFRHQSYQQDQTHSSCLKTLQDVSSNSNKASMTSLNTVNNTESFSMQDLGAYEYQGHDLAHESGSQVPEIVTQGSTPQAFIPEFTLVGLGLVRQLGE